MCVYVKEVEQMIVDVWSGPGLFVRGVCRGPTPLKTHYHWMYPENKQDESRVKATRIVASA